MPQINMNTMLYGSWYTIGEEIVEALYGTHFPDTEDTEDTESNQKNVQPPFQLGLVDLTLFPLISIGVCFIMEEIEGIMKSAFDMGNHKLTGCLLAAGPSLVWGVFTAAFCVLELLRALTVAILSLPLCAMSLLMVPASRLGYQAGIKLGFYGEKDSKDRPGYESAYANNFKLGNLFPAL